jgi:hypothetical protein
MFTTRLQWITGGAFLGSLFWFPARDYVALLLFVVWAAAIGMMVYLNLADKFLWIPVLLALAGVLGSVFVLAIPTNISLTANIATLVLFVASLKVLKKRRASTAF